MKKYRSDEEPLLNERRSSCCRPRIIQFLLLLLLCVVAYIFFWSHSTRNRNFELESENLFYKRAYRNASVQNAVWLRRVNQLQEIVKIKESEVEKCKSDYGNLEARLFECQQQLDSVRADNSLNKCKDELTKCQSESRSNTDKYKLDLDGCQRQLRDLSQAQRGAGGVTPPSRLSGDQQGKFSNGGIEADKRGSGGMMPDKFQNGRMESDRFQNGRMESGKFGNDRMEPGKFGNDRMEPGKFGNDRMEPGKIGGAEGQRENFVNSRNEPGRSGNGGTELGKFGNFGGMVTGKMGNRGLEPQKFDNGGLATGRMGIGGLEPGKQPPVWPSLNMQKQKDPKENQGTTSMNSVTPLRGLNVSSGLVNSNNLVTNQTPPMSNISSRNDTVSIAAANKKSAGEVPANKTGEPQNILDMLKKTFNTVKETNKSADGTSIPEKTNNRENQSSLIKILQDRINQGQLSTLIPGGGGSGIAGSNITKEKNSGVSPPSSNSATENKPAMGQSLNQLNSGNENSSNNNDKSKQLNNDKAKEIKNGSLSSPANGQLPGQNKIMNNTAGDQTTTESDYDGDEYAGEDSDNTASDNKAPVGQSRAVSPPSGQNKTTATPSKENEGKNLSQSPPDDVPDDDDEEDDDNVRYE